jgi:hypothetical protein
MQLLENYVMSCPLVFRTHWFVFQTNLTMEPFWVPVEPSTIFGTVPHLMGHEPCRKLLIEINLWERVVLMVLKSQMQNTTEFFLQFVPAQVN